ncbi:MAG: hypothetical protein HQ546_10665 [Planctomycetes bacterium]|nr:hypothetical protein [Planctomycetota bacterium]
MTDKLASPMWWTWDHSTSWVVDRFGKQTFGASNYYAKAPESFVEDYSRAIQWAAANGIGAIKIAGLLRDSHGGLEAARKVAAFGQDRGVGIIGVVGIVSYGGIYYEGDSPWSLERFLADNPDCMGVGADGKPIRKTFGIYGPRPTRHGCPSNQKLLDYMLRSVEWLFRSIPELAGLAFETGDTGVCQCQKCRRRRITPAESISFDDMALYYPKVVETILSVNPKAQAICETYHHFLPKRLLAPTQFNRGLPAEAADMLAVVPKGAWFQWVCDEWVSGEWLEGAQMPLKGYRHIMRAHFGTYWWGSSRHRLEVEKIRRMCLLSASSGLHAVSLFGESAAYHANDEFNYLAQVYFSAHPQDGLDDFVRSEMSERLGGQDRAADYLAFNGELLAGGVSPETIARIADHAADTDDRARRRWLWLGSYLGSNAWDQGSGLVS